MQYSEEYLVVQLIINWLVIKGGPSSFLAIPSGGVPSYFFTVGGVLSCSPNPDPRPYFKSIAMRDM